MIFSGAEESVRGRVLTTGFHGDKVWAKDTNALGTDIVRGDISGLSFCEHRLSVGCIHFPVPFMGVQQIADIKALSNSSELAPWDVPGDYSRPICRRIAEGAGVARGLFGVKKKAATSLFHQGESVLTDKTREEFYRWLYENERNRVSYSGEKIKIPGKILLAVHERYYLFDKLARWVTHPFSPKVQHWVNCRVTDLQRRLNRRINVSGFIFPWAIQRMADLYKKKQSISNKKCKT